MRFSVQRNCFTRAYRVGTECYVRPCWMQRNANQAGVDISVQASVVVFCSTYNPITATFVKCIVKSLAACWANGIVICIDNSPVVGQRSFVLVIYCMVVVECCRSGEAYCCSVADIVVCVVRTGSRIKFRCRTYAWVECSAESLAHFTAPYLCCKTGTACCSRMPYNF